MPRYRIVYGGQRAGVPRDLRRDGRRPPGRLDHPAPRERRNSAGARRTRAVSRGARRGRARRARLEDALATLSGSQRAMALGAMPVIDGRPPGAAHAKDVDDRGNDRATGQRLYQLVRQPGPVSERSFDSTLLGPRVHAHAVTFR
jgi:Thioredoxin like C-terminal domain